MSCSLLIFGIMVIAENLYQPIDPSFQYILFTLWDKGAKDNMLCLHGSHANINSEPTSPYMFKILSSAMSTHIYSLFRLFIKVGIYRYEKLLNEMLNHLERQPRNKQRRIAWLTHCEPLFNGLGLILLAHFRRLFPLFFKWMHADDDETVLLVRHFLLSGA